MDRNAVIERAALILDERAPEGLNLVVLAQSLGVKPPSLYKHIEGMPGLRRGIMLRAKRDLARVLGKAAIGRSGDAAIGALALAYRRWALEHPGQYPMTIQAPVSGDAEDTRESTAIADVVFGVLAGYGLGEDDAVDATRFLRSSLHGFVDLETSGAFELPVDLERSFAKLTQSIVISLANWTD